MNHSGSGTEAVESSCCDIYDIVAKNYHLPLAVVYVCIFVLGLVNNGTMLFIYARHREMRTPTNIMFISLAIADTLFLLVHVGFFRLGHLFGLLGSIPDMGQVKCRMILFFIGISVGMSPYSVAAVSFQRFVRIVKVSNPKAAWSRSFFTRPPVLHAAMMLLSVIVAIPNTLYSNLCNQDKPHSPLVFWHGMYPIFFYGVLPAVIIVGFYRASIRQSMLEASPREPFRMRTAKVLLALTIVFAVTFTPVLLCEFSRFWYESPLSCEDPVIVLWISAIGIMLFNPVLNPLALCVASVRIRQYFKYYLLFCCKQELELKTQNKAYADLIVLQPQKNNVFCKLTIRRRDSTADVL